MQLNAAWMRAALQQVVGQSDPRAAQQAVAKADPMAEQAVIGSTGALDQDQISGDTISQLVGVRIATPFFGTGFNFCVGEQKSWLVSRLLCFVSASCPEPIVQSQLPMTEASCEACSCDAYSMPGSRNRLLRTVWRLSVLPDQIDPLTCPLWCLQIGTSLVSPKWAL